MSIRTCCLVLGVALAAGGCGKREPEVKRRTFGDERKVVQVRVGEEFALAVSYNPTVSPDYRPELREPLTDCLSLVTTEYKSSDPGSRATGIGGTRYWIMKGVKAGEGKVVFSCKAKELAPPDRIFTVVVAGP